MRADLIPQLEKAKKEARQVAKSLLEARSALATEKAGKEQLQKQVVELQTALREAEVKAAKVQGELEAKKQEAEQKETAKSAAEQKEKEAVQKEKAAVQSAKEAMEKVAQLEEQVKGLEEQVKQGGLGVQADLVAAEELKKVQAELGQKKAEVVELQTRHCDSCMHMARIRPELDRLLLAPCATHHSMCPRCYHLGI